MSSDYASHLLAAHPLLRIARNAALIATCRQTLWAGELRSGDVSSKTAGNDLVTVADAEVEALVTGYFAAVRPADEVVGEEHVAPRELAEVDPEGVIAARLWPVDAAQSDELPTGLRWHVDPIDGTVNFVRGIEHYAFSVGVHDPATDVWLAGLVAAPALNRLWFAARGAGAHRIAPLPWSTDQAADQATGRTVDRTASASAGECRRLTGTPATRSGALLATGFAYLAEDRAAQLSRLEAGMAVFDDIRRCGSAAIDLCLAAEGTVNCYAERGPEIHDWAGGAVIAEEAGLFVQRGGHGALTVAADTAERFAHLRATM